MKCPLDTGLVPLVNGFVPTSINASYCGSPYGVLQQQFLRGGLGRVEGLIRFEPLLMPHGLVVSIMRRVEESYEICAPSHATNRLK